MMSLYIQESGQTDAPIILLLHGGGVSGWMWKEQTTYLSKHHYVLVPDLPGHGRSALQPFVSINQTAKQILALLDDRRNGQSVTIIGFSLGAQIALELTSLENSRINQAIIVSGLVLPMKAALPLITPMIKLFMPLTKSRSFAKVQSRQLYINSNDFDLYYEDSSRMSTKDLVAVMKENMSYQLPASLSASKTRMLALAGAKERKVMIKSAAAIAKRHTNCSSFIIPGVGHGISLANPALFQRIVDGWMKEMILPDYLIPL